jgi:thiamine biosynthesis lipoprotein
MGLQLGCLLLVGCGGGAKEPGLQSLNGKAFGTSWNIKWMGRADPAVKGAVVARLQAVDQAMSTWREDSEIMQVRRGPGAVAVGEHTYFVVKEALALAAQTGGAFDPTVQPLMEFWGFHGEQRATWPTEEDLDEIRQQVGYTKVKLKESDDGGTTIDAGGTALDLSAIAKGYAVDQVAEALSSLGHDQHFVEVGGEVRAQGVGPSGEGWVVGVDRPVEGGAPGVDFAAIFRLRDRSMATSGNYRNQVTVGDKRVGHTLDPRSGLPVESALLSATVLAPDCRTADGLATALMVLGPEEGLGLIEQLPGVEALILVEGAEGIEERASSSLSLYRLKQ